MPPPLFSDTFPTFIKDLSQRDLKIFWYNAEFTQSRYPPGQQSSEACTLICLLLAQKIIESQMKIRNIDDNHSELEVLIAKSIIDGNKIHSLIIEMKLVPHPYLTADEALKFGGNQVKNLSEWDSTGSSIEKNLTRNIEKYLNEWFKKPKSDTLIMLLITCGRTVLFIFQLSTLKITFFDPHSHATTKYNNQRGLVLAQTNMDKLDKICHWYINTILYGCFNVKCHQYELSFIYQLKTCHCLN